MFGKVESLDQIDTLRGRQIGTQLSGKYVNDSSPRFVPAFKEKKNLKENWTKIWMLIQLCFISERFERFLGFSMSNSRLPEKFRG